MERFLIYNHFEQGYFIGEDLQRTAWTENIAAASRMKSLAEAKSVVKILVKESEFNILEIKTIYF